MTPERQEKFVANERVRNTITAQNKGGSKKSVYIMTKPEQDYPLWRKTKPVRIDISTLRLAERQIDSCEACTPDRAEIPFDYILDSVTGCDPEVTDYVLPEPARCSRCGAAVRTGFWRWYKSNGEGRKVFVLPGTLVVLKRA